MQCNSVLGVMLVMMVVTLYPAISQADVLEQLDSMDEVFSYDFNPDPVPNAPIEQQQDFEIPAQSPGEPLLIIQDQNIYEMKKKPEEETPNSQVINATVKQPDVATLSIEYKKGKMVRLNTAYGTKFDVYALGPDNATVAVLIIHDRWGMTEGVKIWARRFAQRGYLAIAADLYGGRLVKDEKSARKMMRSLDSEGLNAKFAGMIDFLHQSGHRIVVAGWGVGADHALDITNYYPDKVSATITYYGDSGDEDQRKLRAIKTPVLGVYTKLDVVGPSDSAFAQRIGEEAWQVTTDFLEKKFE